MPRKALLQRLELSVKMMLAVCAIVVALTGYESRAVSAAIGIPFDAATATEESAGFTLKWHAEGARTVRIYAGTTLRPTAHDRLVAIGSAQGIARVSNLPPKVRWYFTFVPDRGHSLTLAERSLNLGSASDFRDVGGYRTADGKWVRMGMAYRSNGLGALVPADYERIRELNLHLICDLRLEEERGRLPDPEFPGASKVSADVAADSGHGVSGIRSAIASGDHTAVVRYMKGAYRDFVDIPSARNAYRKLLERLADPGSLPTVFHCTAGKDRTGWGQAILLSILRVPRRTIVEDYTMTDQFMSASALEQIHRSLPQADPSMSQAIIAADPLYLEAAFREVDARFGSFANYLRQGLGVSDDTVAAIRANFLAD